MAKFLDLTGLTHFWSKVKTYIDGAVSAAKTTVGNYTINGKKISSNPTLSKGDLGLGNVTNDAQVKRAEMGIASGVATLGDDGKIPASQLPAYLDDVLEYAGNVSGISVQSASSSNVDAVYYDTTNKCFVGKSGSTYYNNWLKVNNEDLPAENFGELQLKGAIPYKNKIYVDTSNNRTYKWSGTSLTQLDAGLTIGETSSTAFAGNRGKALEDWKAALKNKYALTLGSDGDVTPNESSVTLNLSYFDINTPSLSGSQPIDIPAATQEKAGVMSKTDKIKLNGLSNTPDATGTVAGKVKLGSDTVQTVAAQTPGTASGKTYPIQKNSNGQLVVNVPWTDNNTTYESISTTDIDGLFS